MSRKRYWRIKTQYLHAVLFGMIASAIVAIAITLVSGPSPNSAADLGLNIILRTGYSDQIYPEGVPTRNYQLRELIEAREEKPLFDQLIQMDEKVLLQLSTGICIGQVCESYDPTDLAAMAEKALEYRDRGWRWWGDVFTKAIAILSLFISALAFLKSLNLGKKRPSVAESPSDQGSARP